MSLLGFLPNRGIAMNNWFTKEEIEDLHWGEWIWVAMGLLSLRLMILAAWMAVFVLLFP